MYRTSCSKSLGRIVRPTLQNRRGVTTTGATTGLPLSGIRVLELGQAIAGPFAGQLLGHFGAEVIKVEAPTTGDPLRVWRGLDVDGTSTWWRSMARNKKSVTIDMRQQEGRDLVKKLAIKSDVVLENFRPGTLEKWGLGPADLHPLNPELIFTRVSGYGQTGPWSVRPGYASVIEAESGFRYMNGFPDPETGRLSGPPVRPNMSLGDSVAGLHAAFGTVLAILSRHQKAAKGQSGGQTVDVSIFESMWNLMEAVVPEYDRKGTVRGPSGSSVTGIVPTNAYPCLPSPEAPDVPVYIIIGANSDSIYKRMMKVMERPDRIGPDFEHNHNRVAHQEQVETAISEWTSKHSAEEAEKILTAAGVPAGRVFNVKDIMELEHVRARGMVEEVRVEQEGKEGWNLKIPRVYPLLEGCESNTRWAGPDLGQHTEEVLVEELGISSKEFKTLKDNGILG